MLYWYFGILSGVSARDIDHFVFRRKWHVELNFYDSTLNKFHSYTPFVAVKQASSKKDVHIEHKILKNPLPVLTVNIDLIHDTKAICKEIEDLVNDYKDKRWDNKLEEKYKEAYIPRESDYLILKYLFEEEKLGQYKQTTPESEQNRRADFVSNKLKDEFPDIFEKVDATRKRCIKIEDFITKS